MVKTLNQERPYLLVSRDEARKRISQQIEKGKKVPNESVNKNDEARRWYEFTAELLRHLFSTDELVDKFTGKGGYNISVSEEDISPSSYLKILTSIYDRLELYHEKIPTTSRSTSNQPIEKIKNLIIHFHAVVRQLRHRHNRRPTLEVNDEYDVQDLMHSMLKIYFEDIRPEEWTPSYAGGSSRMDFLLKSEKIVIEVKKTREKLNAKEVGDQLAVDILRYRSHQDCKTLICFIYDPEERISNPRGLEQDLNRSNGELQVMIIIIQR
jgi:hypothetical protein